MTARRSRPGVMAAWRLPLLVGLCAVLVAGCGDKAAGTTASPTVTGVRGICGSAAAPRTIRHVVWIVMENKAFDDVIARREAPYTNALAARCGVARGFVAERHPS